MRDDAFAVDADDLSGVVDELRRRHAALASLGGDLSRRIALLHDTWDGEAATAHETAQATWDDGFARMREALARMRAAAEVAHRNYTDAATTNLQMWEQVG